MNQLAAALRRPTPVFATLTLDPLTARLAQDCGFEFGYVSGGALGYSYGVSEALLTMTEIVDVTGRVAERSGLGVIADGGVGFGDPVHVFRAVQELESGGACAVEIEDQVAPKRVSHHRGIEHLVAAEVMVQKIEQAAAARRSDDFLIIARTGAVRNESFDAALERLDAYRQAGADVLMLMPEDESQMAAARGAFDVPLATITALDARTPESWAALGWNLIIDPFTAQVQAFEVVRRAYQSFQDTGTTDMSPARLFEIYRELPSVAGLDPLYAIEDVTTERT